MNEFKKALIIIAKGLLVGLLVLIVVVVTVIMTDEYGNIPVVITKHDGVKIDKKMSYELEVIKKDSVIVYHYHHNDDAERDMKFRYVFNENKMYFGPTVLHKEQDSIIVRGKTINMFSPVYNEIDGMNFIYFNQELGVLLLDNGWEEFIMVRGDENNIDLMDHLNLVKN